MLKISNMASNQKFETYVAYSASKSNYLKSVDNAVIISNRLDRNIHLKLAYCTGMNGCYSKNETRKFLNKISEIKPDIIHLHNLHNCYINLEMLFDYLKNQSIPVVWTLHDCWSFTGQCPYYTFAKCDKWIRGCHSCPQIKAYPAARVDKTEEMYRLKKSWFTGLDNLTIVTPSDWLKSQVKESFLTDYPVKVINNGIDLSIFKPRESNFRDKYKLNKKIILLGVANPWSKRKGLLVFKELSKLLDSEYKIVLVGLNDEQINQLPSNILGLPKTNNPKELAEIYSVADYFINPSVEETMGLVTVEAIACGTPAIVSNSTAVPEMVNYKCGVVVKRNSSEGFFETIRYLDKEYKLEDLINHARKFNKDDKFFEYIELYREILKV